MYRYPNSKSQVRLCLVHHTIPLQMKERPLDLNRVTGGGGAVSTTQSRPRLLQMKERPLDLNRVTGGGGAVSMALYDSMMLDTVSVAWVNMLRSMYCS